MRFTSARSRRAGPRWGTEGPVLWGPHRGVIDPCGNYWGIGTHIEDVSHEEMEKRFAAMVGKQ